MRKTITSLVTVAMAVVTDELTLEAIAHHRTAATGPVDKTGFDAGPAS